MWNYNSSLQKIGLWLASLLSPKAAKEIRQDRTIGCQNVPGFQRWHAATCNQGLLAILSNSFSQFSNLQLSSLLGMATTNKDNLLDTTFDTRCGKLFTIDLIFRMLYTSHSQDSWPVAAFILTVLQSAWVSSKILFVGKSGWNFHVTQRWKTLEYRRTKTTERDKEGKTAEWGKQKRTKFSRVSIFRNSNGSDMMICSFKQ